MQRSYYIDGEVSLILKIIILVNIMVIIFHSSGVKKLYTSLYLESKT